jgi:hypothetical protein
MPTTSDPKCENRLCKCRASTVFITGVPYAIGSSRLFLAPVYAVFNALERESNRKFGTDERLIQKILLANPTLRIYLREQFNKAIEKWTALPLVRRTLE